MQELDSESVLLSRPSATALTTAGLRAVATYEIDSYIKGPDHLARIFLTDESRAILYDQNRREIAKQNVNPGAYPYLIARTKLIDNLFAEALKNKMPQIVLLGAGFDTRACRFNHLNKSTKVFELDLPSTQAWKQECFRQHNIKLPDNLIFTPTQFNLDNLSDDLNSSGFIKNTQTLFIWEGVTPYLGKQDVVNTCRFITDNAAPGSQVVFDYVHQQALDYPQQYLGFKYVLEWANSSGEPFRFGIDANNVDDFLQEVGLELIENFSPSELERLYLTASNGQLFGSSTTFYSIAHAQVK